MIATPVIFLTIQCFQVRCIANINSEGNASSIALLLLLSIAPVEDIWPYHLKPEWEPSSKAKEMLDLGMDGYFSEERQYNPVHINTRLNVLYVFYIWANQCQRQENVFAVKIFIRPKHCWLGIQFHSF